MISPLRGREHNYEFVSSKPVNGPVDEEPEDADAFDFAKPVDKVFLSEGLLIGETRGD